jgi:hypothetical protein
MVATYRGILAIGDQRRVDGSYASADGTAADTCKFGDPPICRTNTNVLEGCLTDGLMWE